MLPKKSNLRNEQLRYKIIAERADFDVHKKASILKFVFYLATD
jgi:hypothetical protein